MKQIFFMASLGIFTGVLIGCYLFGTIELHGMLTIFPLFAMMPAKEFAKKGHHTWDFLADHLDHITREEILPSILNQAVIVDFKQAC